MADTDNKEVSITNYLSSQWNDHRFSDKRDKRNREIFENAWQNKTIDLKKRGLTNLSFDLNNLVI